MIIIKANTHSEVKFICELSDPFEIRTGVKQGDGLSPLLFNCALEKVVREWNTRIKSGIRLGSNKKNIKISCLCGQYGSVVRNHGRGKGPIFELWQQAAKMGLTVSFEKTKIMINIEDPPKNLRIHEQKIEVVREFRYLE